MTHTEGLPPHSLLKRQMPENFQFFITSKSHANEDKRSVSCFGFLGSGANLEYTFYRFCPTEIRCAPKIEPLPLPRQMQIKM